MLSIGFLVLRKVYYMVIGVLLELVLSVLLMIGLWGEWCRVSFIGVVFLIVIFCFLFCRLIYLFWY